MPRYQLSGQKMVIMYTFLGDNMGNGGEIPYLIKVNQGYNDYQGYQCPLTLKDVKELSPRKGLGLQYRRFFFKTASEGFEVFEEVHADEAEVPMLGRRIEVECWIDIDIDIEMCLNYQKLTKN